MGTTQKTAVIRRDGNADRRRSPVLRGASEAVNDRKRQEQLRRAALACARFSAWWELAGVRSKNAFRVFPRSELKRRFTSFRVSLSGVEGTLPPAARRSLESVREGIRSEIEECTGREVSFGVFFVDEVSRLSELLKLYAREAGFTDKELAPRERRDGTEMAGGR